MVARLKLTLPVMTAIKLHPPDVAHMSTLTDFSVTEKQWRTYLLLLFDLYLFIFLHYEIKGKK